MIKLTRPLIFFDLETTGVDVGKDKIVQFAAVKVVTDPDGVIRETVAIDRLIDPHMYIPAEATAVHHITDEDVKSQPYFGDVAPELYDYMLNCDWAGYNIINFDVPLLLREFEACGYRFDPLPKFVDCFRIFKEDQPHTLVGAYKHYVRPDGFDDAHNASADVNATLDVFRKQIELPFLPETVEEIHEHYRKPGQVDIAGKMAWDGNNVVFTFGKHKGVPVMNAPQNYLKWCKKESVLASDAWSIIRKLYRGDDLTGVF